MSRLNENLGGSAPQGPIDCLAQQQPPAAACKLCFSLQAGRSCQEVPGDSCCSWKGTFSCGTDGGVEERGRGRGVFVTAVLTLELWGKERASAAICPDQHALHMLTWLIATFLSTIQTNSKLQNPFSFPARLLSKGTHW